MVRWALWFNRVEATVLAVILVFVIINRLVGGSFVSLLLGTDLWDLDYSHRGEAARRGPGRSHKNEY